MATLADLAARIADDLERSDLTTQIATAIKDAVTVYESQRFSFNEVYNQTTTFSTSVDSILLTALPFYPLKLDRVRLKVSGNQNLTDLIPRDYAYLMAGQDVKAVCRPVEYCIYSERLQLDSMPDQNYTAVLDGIKRISTASANTDATAWFNEAKNLIRARVKVDLYAHVIKEPDLATQQAAIEQREFRTLKQKLNTHGSGRIRPTEW